MAQSKQDFEIKGSRDAIGVRQGNHYAKARHASYAASNSWQARSYIVGFERCDYELNQGTSESGAHWVATGKTEDFGKGISLIEPKADQLPALPEEIVIPADAWEPVADEVVVANDKALLAGKATPTLDSLVSKADKAPNGYIVYRGPSLLDGAPIVVVAITASTNEKTGNMVQTYIMRDDVKPTDALKTGEDSSVCGDCKHRPINGGACYVRVFQGPLVVWKGVHLGRYPVATPEQVGKMVAGRMVRLGSYGDPMAVPANVWEALTAHAEGHTGYSHQWQNEGIDEGHKARVMALCMASADSAEEAEAARLANVRYFRIRTADEAVSKGEFVCPASEEAGKRKTCATCGACNGTDDKGSAKASPVIVVHGPTKSRFAVQRSA
jgi:hypothetical protein